MRTPKSGLLLLVLLSACASPQQTPKTSRTVVTSDSIAARIDRSVPTLRRDTTTVLELSAEGATLEAAYRDTTLQRLRAVYLGEMGRATESFYFDSVLVLVVRGEVRYDSLLSGRIADSTTTHFDLRGDSTARAARDSLQAEARSLLRHLASATKR